MNKFQRSEHIEKLVETSQNQNDPRTFSFRFRNEEIHPVVIKVETRFLLFRLVNGRTRRKQIEFLDLNSDFDSDIFTDPESLMAQEVQREILLKLAKEDGLYENLKNELMKNPAIITHDGFVINGNRRLAALIDMGEQYMDCCVLPENSVPLDLYELELELQMSRDFIADYNWVDELLHIRYGLELLKDEKAIIAKKMRLELKELEQKIRMLILVDLYLEWLNKPGMYHIIEKHEQVFMDMEKFHNKLKSELEQKNLRNMVFNIITSPPKEGRLYTHVKQLIKYFDKTIQKYKTELEESSVDDNSDLEENDITDNPLIDLASLDDDSNIDLEIFNNPEKAEENSEKLIETIITLNEQEKEKNDRNASFKAVSDAQRKLQSVTLDINTLNLQGISNKLDEIDRIISNLRTSIQNFENE